MAIHDNFPFIAGYRIRRCWKCGLKRNSKDMRKVDGHWMCPHYADMQARTNAVKQKKTIPAIGRRK